jgi:hypothetical protein
MANGAMAWQPAMRRRISNGVMANQWRNQWGYVSINGNDVIGGEKRNISLENNARNGQ